jgi:ATP-dependent Clp protease ATP-binding subunit ClpC
VILFDEIEKAHPEVWNVLLQVLDDGRLTDGQGHVVDFRNTVIIMTSNIGTELTMRGGRLGFGSAGEAESDDRYAEDIRAALKRAFRPEFLNRIDEVMVFHNLNPEHISAIVDLQVSEIAERVTGQGYTLELTEEARSWLTEKGYDRQFGARPLRRLIQRQIEAPLSKRMIAGEFEVGDVILVAVDEDGESLVFERRESDPIPLEHVIGEPTGTSRESSGSTGDS